MSNIIKMKKVNKDGLLSKLAEDCSGVTEYFVVCFEEEEAICFHSSMEISKMLHLQLALKIYIEDIYRESREFDAYA